MIESWGGGLMNHFPPPRDFPDDMLIYEDASSS